MTLTTLRTADPLAPSSELLMREFDDLSLRIDEHHDGLTVEAQLVPYGREIDAVDLRGDGMVRYREMFTEGANARAVKAPNRVALTFLHDEALTARLGYGQQFREDETGLYGRFRLYPSNAPLARDILMSSHRSISVGFVSLNPRAGSERDGDRITRRSVILRHAAAVEQGQYSEASVLAVRAREAELEESDQLEESAREADATEAELLAWVEEAAAAQRALDERFGSTD